MAFSGQVKSFLRVFWIQISEQSLFRQDRPFGFAEKKSPHLAALGSYFFSQSLALKKGLGSGEGWYQKTGGSGRLTF